MTQWHAKEGIGRGRRRVKYGVFGSHTLCEEGRKHALIRRNCLRIDAKHAWHIAKKCVNGFKTQVELEGVDRYKHDVEATDEYTFEGMEASFADESRLDGKLSWKRFDHQQVLQALGEKDN